MTTGRRLFQSFPAVALGLACLAPTACGLVTKVQELPVVERFGFGIEVPCDINLYQQRRMTGAYLQIAVGSAGGVAHYVTGRPSRKALPRNLVIEEDTIRRLRPEEENGQTRLEGWKRASAVPVAGLGPGTELPAAYTFNFRSQKIDYTGPLVVGQSPTATEIPKAGLSTITGPVRVTFTATDATGKTEVTDALGSFTLQIGYGTGRASFVASGFTADSGPALPFDSFSWSRLGLCAPRVVSSGQGTVRFTGPDGGRVGLLTPGLEPAALLSFEASQFAGTDRPGPPGAAGGVFAIQGNSATLTGVFLSQPSP
ncbi:hypothetical protein DSD19_12895 [Rhodovulum sp. BSW8]|uniref:Carboxypeptidase regulatory-like domain-containing protein n=1 Tax=Rhodovulum visakhapatnamense TaxID=364297 RepID=A0A4R8G0C4_9RHOB|nr:hypothetical protein [Rhodovulum]RBO52831.1 hypothetical protein DSD19_12895 [Rhodovulum sp. BSW8]TDX32516.1 hypothetical protein EV657_10385 [Rhodovulum visakhapatnamense]